MSDEIYIKELSADELLELMGAAFYDSRAQEAVKEVVPRMLKRMPIVGMRLWL